MLVVGVILTILGVVAALYGVAQLAGLIAEVFSTGITFIDPYLFWIIAGAIVAVIGIILMIASKKKAVH